MIGRPQLGRERVSPPRQRGNRGFDFLHLGPAEWEFHATRGKEIHVHTGLRRAIAETHHATFSVLSLDMLLF
jgi:hypothetical protein